MNELARIASDMTKANAELERTINALSGRNRDADQTLTDARCTLRVTMLLIQGWQAVIKETADNPRYTIEDTEWTPDPDHPIQRQYDNRPDDDTTTGLHIEVRD